MPTRLLYTKREVQISNAKSPHIEWKPIIIIRQGDDGDDDGDNNNCDHDGEQGEGKDDD